MISTAVYGVLTAVDGFACTVFLAVLKSTGECIVHTVLGNLEDGEKVLLQCNTKLLR